MARVYRKDELPHLHSTRDTRDRLDLIKDGVQVEQPRLHADRVVYHPGDTAAAHYHKGCKHLFAVLYGEGVICTPSGAHRLTPGMAAVVDEDEIHWFENNTGANFSFVEFWSPPPAETIWIDTDDV